MLNILNIEVVWFDDGEAHATDRLGVYSAVPGQGAIDRLNEPGYQPTEHRYWIPAQYDPEYPENARQDYLRHEALCRGEWRYQFCAANALVSYQDGDHLRVEKLSSGGLCGVESDSSPLYLLEIEIEQLEDLKKHVQVFGVPWTANQETVLTGAKHRLVVLRSQLEKDSLD